MKGTKSVRSAALGNFFYSSLVPAAFKRSVYKKLYHFFCISLTNKAGGDTEYIGIVMFSCQLGKLFAPANGRTDALVFVRSDRHAIGAAAKKYSKRGFTFFNGISNRVSEVGVIYRIFGMCAIIMIGKIFGFEKGN